MRVGEVVGVVDHEHSVVDRRCRLAQLVQAYGTAQELLSETALHHAAELVEPVARGCSPVAVELKLMPLAHTVPLTDAAHALDDA